MAQRLRTYDVFVAFCGSFKLQAVLQVEKATFTYPGQLLCSRKPILSTKMGHTLQDSATFPSKKSGTLLVREYYVLSMPVKTLGCPSDEPGHFFMSMPIRQNLMHIVLPLAACCSVGKCTSSTGRSVIYMLFQLSPHGQYQLGSF